LEDSIRLATVRQTRQFEDAAIGSIPENFLKEANAIVHFDFNTSTRDPRSLELVNKTNQFNLNGIRYTVSDWLHELACPDVQLIGINYEDRFGQLGKIAVIVGIVMGDTLNIRVWAMSCRAFGRRIEYLCLRTCLERFQIGKIKFDFVATAQNTPLREFLTALLGKEPGASAVLTRERFEEACPKLYHTVNEMRRPELDGRPSEPVGKMF
jgi:FkbH-like protein